MQLCKYEVTYYEKVQIQEFKDLKTPAGNELLLTIDDYEIWYRIFLKDPEDEDAYEMLKDCENYIMNEPSVRHFISEPGEFLFELDEIILDDFERRMACRE